jgi:hypothetical protein
MKLTGALRQSRSKTTRVNRLICTEFEAIDPEDRE